ncbi:hypothetical protein B0J14DRAFT_643465 [Halenospora varia]|nr:hypothetical protein B0J14DRAFT_643465 [Halenospora varia]
MSTFSSHLLSTLTHTFNQGLLLATLPSLLNFTPDTSTSQGILQQKYITKALSNDLHRDKLFALRKTGSSMKYIHSALPPPISPTATSKSIFQLCIWRTFAFGNADFLEKLTLFTTPETQDEETESDFEAINTMIQTFGAPGTTKILLPAYGQLSIIKAKVPSMLSKLWSFAQELSSSLSPKSPLLSFAEVQKRLLEKEIPTIGANGLLVWVLICDLSEYGLCSPPTPKDLAVHIIPPNPKKKGPSGPTKGLQLVAERNDVTAPLGSIEELALVFEEVMKAWEQMESKEIKELVARCEELQGRVLNMADLEHGLCKIAREEDLRAGRRGKKKIGGGGEVEGKGAKGGKKRKVKAEEEDDDEQAEDKEVTTKKKRARKVNAEDNEDADGEAEESVVTTKKRVRKAKKGEGEVKAASKRGQSKAKGDDEDD